MEVYWAETGGNYDGEEWEYTTQMNGILVAAIAIDGGTSKERGVIALPNGKFTTIKLDVLRHKEIITKKTYKEE